MLFIELITLGMICYYYLNSACPVLFLVVDCCALVSFFCCGCITPNMVTKVDDNNSDIV